MDNVTEEQKKYIEFIELSNKINLYGRELVEKDGKEFIRSNVTNFDAQQRTVKEFRILEQGCETWLDDEKYPMRMCFQHDRITALHHFKRFVPTILRTFKKGKIISVLYFVNNWKEFIKFFHHGLGDVFYPDIKYYSQPVREVYRVLSGYGEWIDKIRDIICAILEHDTAYRYRFQDIIVELNKKLFYKNPSKEIRRLINIIRDRGDRTTNKGNSVYGLLHICLLFSKKLRHFLFGIVSKINIEELRSSKEDIYWQNARYEGYNFRGIDNDERKRIYQIELDSIK